MVQSDDSHFLRFRKIGGHSLHAEFFHHDPQAFVAPVTIQGQALLRKVPADCSDCDALLPMAKELLESWQ